MDWHDTTNGCFWILPRNASSDILDNSDLSVSRYLKVGVNSFRLLLNNIQKL